MTVNPFMIAIAVLQFGAAIYELVKGDKRLSVIYLCYAVATVMLIIIGNSLTTPSSEGDN